MEERTSSRQKYLGDKGLILLLAFLGAFVPLSMDFYLPALPGMSVYFKVPVNLINLTLILFFIFFSSSVLLWGPLSDKYGRKPALIIGLVIYVIASISCAYSNSIIQLIVFRAFQALGGGAAVALSTAMIKDVYEGEKRESIMALVQTLYFIAPAIAPILGAIVLKYATWRGVFWVLAIIGCMALAGSIALQETIGKRSAGSLLQTMGRLGSVLKNPGFSSLLIIFSLTGIPLGSYIAASSYIYINTFELSEQVYSYYFAVNALCLMTGPMIYVRLFKRYKRRTIITGCLSITALSGLLTCILGGLNPWLFALSLIPGTIAGSSIRPPSTILMLEQQLEDTGSASALINCFRLFLGSIGMILVSFKGLNLVFIIGLVNLMSGVVCGALWIFISGKSFVRQIPDFNTASTNRAAC
ncbi:MAG: multidrug effflux MFS transporter [Syntrophomonas sp.]